MSYDWKCVCTRSSKVFLYGGNALFHDIILENNM